MCVCVYVCVCSTARAHVCVCMFDLLKLRPKEKVFGGLCLLLPAPFLGLLLPSVSPQAARVATATSNTSVSQGGERGDCRKHVTEIGHMGT